jgi:DNA repair protein RAD16
MGKTLQMIGLIVTTKIKPNLILCPTVAILQWYAEFQERLVKDTLKVLVFHGADRIKSVDVMSEYDVVLSTYSIVESMYRKQQYGFKRKDAPNFMVCVLELS